MQIGFYYDQSRCIGCYTCVGACRSWQQLDQDIPNLIKLVKQDGKKRPELSLTHLFLTCFHCAQPSCVTACPEGLLMKREEDGIVVITEPQRCTNCELCVDACPYNAPKVVSGGKVNLVKCNLCLDRIKEGRSPACVVACPTEALAVGPMPQLESKYGNLRELKNFADYRQTNPSVVFRAMNTEK